MSERIEALERLQKLKEAGVLNESEFVAQKGAILESNDSSYLHQEADVIEENDDRIAISDEDINVDFALRGRRRFSIYKFVAVLILFVYVAIEFDLPDIAQDTFSKILIVVAILAFKFVLDFLYKTVPVAAMLAVSLVIAIPFYIIGNLLVGNLIGIAAGFCGFLSSMIHGYRGSKYFGRRENV